MIIVHALVLRKLSQFRQIIVSLCKVSSKFSPAFRNNHIQQSGVCNFKADSRLSHIIVCESELWGLIMTTIWQWHVTSFIWAIFCQDGMWKEVPHSKRSCRGDGKSSKPRRTRHKGSPRGKGIGEWCNLLAQWGIFVRELQKAVVAWSLMVPG